MSARALAGAVANEGAAPIGSSRITGYLFVSLYVVLLASVRHRTDCVRNYLSLKVLGAAFFVGTAPTRLR